MKNISRALIGLLLFGSLTVSAQMGAPRADARQQAQRKRIADGHRDGELTKREATYLNREQQDIRRSERRVEADGKVTKRERQDLKENKIEPAVMFAGQNIMSVTEKSRPLNSGKESPNTKIARLGDLLFNNPYQALPLFI